MDDDLVAQFSAITSADPQQAAQYLQLTENNLEQAIQLYFEGGPLDIGGAGSAPPTSADAASSSGQEAARPPAFTHPQDVVHIDSDDDMSDDFDIDGAEPAVTGTRTDPQPIEDDEAMARRLQEEMYGSGGAAVGDDVRAPIARTTETLVGPDADWASDPDTMRAAVAEQLMARQQRRPAGICQLS